MRFRYLFLIPELVLLFFFLAPIYKRICNPGNLGGALVCLLLIFITVFPQKFAHLIAQLWQHLAGKIGLSVLSVCIAAGLIFCTAMSVQMARTIASKPEQPHAVIVLGCKVRGTRPSAMLTRRLEAALSYLEAHPEVQCITSGGQGAGEDIPEGQAMKTWLVEHGIAESRILVEDLEGYGRKPEIFRSHSCRTGTGQSGCHYHRRFSRIPRQPSGKAGRPGNLGIQRLHQASVCSHLLGTGMDGTV